MPQEYDPATGFWTATRRKSRTSRQSASRARSRTARMPEQAPPPPATPAGGLGVYSEPRNPAGQKCRRVRVEADLWRRASAAAAAAGYRSLDVFIADQLRHLLGEGTRTYSVHDRSNVLLWESEAG